MENDRGQMQVGDISRHSAVETHTPPGSAQCIGGRRPDDPARSYDANILIVDEHEEAVITIEYILRRSGYRSVHSSLDSRDAFRMIAELRPDLMILGLSMPAPDGFAILDHLASGPGADQNVPVLIVAPEVNQGAKVKALAKGVRGFLASPIDFVDLLVQVRSSLEWRFLTSDLRAEQRRGRLSASRTTEGTDRELDLETGMLRQLRRIFDCLDPARTLQAEKTAEIAALLGSALGLSEDSVSRLALAARVFDFGMLAVPDAIRTCDRKLTPDELKIMQRHTVAVRDMFGDLRIPGTELLLDVTGAHHERWDGKGYPRGIKGREIPLAGRIVAVAQYYGALLADRPYRPAMAPVAALAEVSRQRGYAFDPEVVDALLQALGDPAASRDLVGVS